MEKMLRNKWMIALFVLPAFLLYSLVLPWPIVKSIYYSFLDWNVIGAGKFIGFHNYVEMFTNDDIFLHALNNTVIFLVESMVLQLPLAFALAYTLSRKFKGAMFYRNIYFLPVIISGTAIGLLWQFIYHSDIGLINTIIRLFGFPDFDYAWLSNRQFAIHAVVISVSWQYFGYHMIIYLGGLTTISPEVMESARMDGARSFQLVRHIVLPLIKPFISISLVLITTGSVKAFDNVISLTGGGPAHSSDVLALHMYDSAFGEMRYGYGSAISVLLLVMNIVFTLVITTIMSERQKKVMT